MKATKTRNQQIYRATTNTIQKQLSSPLSKDLQKKYGKRSARVTEGDSVKVMRGEYKGIDGKVSKVSTAKNAVAVEGIKKEKSKGDKFDIYIHTSNITITGLNTDDGWRKSKLEGKKKSEISKTEKPKEVKTEKPKTAEKKSESKPEKKETKTEKPKVAKKEEKTE